MVNSCSHNLFNLFIDFPMFQLGARPHPVNEALIFDPFRFGYDLFE